MYFQKLSNAQEMVPLIVFSIKANLMIMSENYGKYIFFNTVCFSNKKKRSRGGSRQQAMKERGENVFAVG